MNFVVKIKDTQTRVKRTFTVDGEFARHVRKYSEIRPKVASSNRFFLCYQNGKCKNQVIGKNKFATMPHTIAKYLGLPDVTNYTGI